MRTYLQEMRYTCNVRRKRHRSSTPMHLSRGNSNLNQFTQINETKFPYRTSKEIHSFVVNPNAIQTKNVPWRNHSAAMDTATIHANIHAVQVLNVVFFQMVQLRAHVHLVQWEMLLSVVIPYPMSLIHVTRIHVAKVPYAKLVTREIVYVLFVTAHLDSRVIQMLHAFP